MFSSDALARHAEIGLSLLPEHQGRGYGKDVLRVLLGFGFRTRNLRRIHLQTLASNAAALAAYRAVGFVEEGRLREHAWVEGRTTTSCSWRCCGRSGRGAEGSGGGGRRCLKADPRAFRSVSQATSLTCDPASGAGAGVGRLPFPVVTAAAALTRPPSLSASQPGRVGRRPPPRGSPARSLRHAQALLPPARRPALTAPVPHWTSRCSTGAFAAWDCRWCGLGSLP
jgi:hypothetical protein